MLEVEYKSGVSEVVESVIT